MKHTSQRDAEWWDNFKRLLDEQNDWPAPFLFKFIVPLEGAAELKRLFAHVKIETRASSKGNYISVTMQPVMQSSEEVVEVYEIAGRVEGVIML